MIDFLKRMLTTGHRYVTLEQYLWYRLAFKSCRYKITEDIGEGHKVLGKVMQCSLFSTNEVDKLQSYMADMDVRKCAVYSRVILSEVLYTRVTITVVMTLWFA